MDPVQLGDHPFVGLQEEHRLVVGDVDLQWAVEEPGRVASTLSDDPKPRFALRSSTRQTPGVLDRFEFPATLGNHLQADRMEIL